MWASHQEKKEKGVRQSKKANACVYVVSTVDLLLGGVSGQGRDSGKNNVLAFRSLCEDASLLRLPHASVGERRFVFPSPKPMLQPHALLRTQNCGGGGGGVMGHAPRMS